MIAIGLSPNTQLDDVFLAISVLLTPWRWFKGSAIKSLEDWFKRYFNSQFAILFDSGRSCEYAILRALGIGQGDEVLIQAFTCVAVPNSILWVKAVPVYIDIDKTGNLDVSDLEEKITDKSRAIIVQHTLGVAADIEKASQVAKKYKLILIEDCAHALGASFHGKKVGTFGDFAFFSFGRDKVISSVFGGMVVTNSKKYAKLLRGFQRNLAFPSAGWIVAQLFHPIAFLLILPLYNVVNIGKILLVIFQKLHLLSKPVAKEEKKGIRPSFYPKKLPNAQAFMVLHQVKKLSSCNAKRQEVARFYAKALQDLPITLPQIKEGDIMLRYNLQTQHASPLYQFAKERSILLGRWYSHVVDPQDVDLLAVGYRIGSCPKAEFVARQSLNLPTYPRMTLVDAGKVVEVIKEYFRKP